MRLALIRLYGAEHFFLVMSLVWLVILIAAVLFVIVT
jgi:hypothetical protein